MTITEALELIEKTHVRKSIEKLATSNPKGLLDFWVNLKEFEQPKINRSTFEPTTDQDIEIKITYDENPTNTHKSISKTLGESKPN